MPIVRLIGPSRSDSVRPSEVTSSRYLSLYFSTSVSAEHTQYSAWRDLMQPSRTSERSQNLTTEMHCWSFGDLVLMRMVFSGPPSPQAQECGIGNIQNQLCLVLAKAGKANRYISSAQLSCMPADPRLMAVDDHSDYVEMITLLVPAEEMEIDIQKVARNCGRSTSAAFLMADFIERLASQLPHALIDCSTHLAAMTRALIAAYVSHGIASGVQAEASSRSMLLAKAQLIVRQNMSSPDFGPDQLCHLLAVSRSKLYRLFEDSGGVVHFINRLRLSAAHHQLTDSRSGSQIHAIGNGVGFTDHSTFSRAFKRQFGYSPSQAREMAFLRKMNGGEYKVAGTAAERISGMGPKVPK